MNEYYLYFHRNPTTKEIFYIGIGKGRRAYRTEFRSRNKFWRHYVKKHGSPIVEIHFRNSQRSRVAAIEKILIKSFGRRFDGTGRLVNISDGGEKGSVGVVPWNKGKNHSEETRLKISKANTDNPKLRNIWVGRKHSDSSKKKQSIAKKGVANLHRIGAKHSSEARLKISIARTGSVISEETRMKQSLSHIGKTTRSVDMFDIDGRFVRKFASVGSAAEFIGKSSQSVCDVCRGRNKTAGGYKFKYSICL